MFDMENV